VLDDDELPCHPHWDLIFDHAFNSLTPILKTLPWAKDAKIKIGGDYGRAWVACMFRDPFQPLPYLFFYGPENSGKSIIHEAVSHLVTKGVVKADRALTTRGDFNGELANAILAVIEEKQIANHPGAIAKIRDWVTTRSLSIRRMRTDSYEQPSTLHFMQFSNWFHSVPIFPGDTRAMVIEVPPFTGTEIPKKKMLALLEKEAPHFMRTIMDLELPEPTDRLRLPFVETADKAELANETAPVNRFLTERCKVEPGQKIIKVQLHSAYKRWARDNGFEEMEIGDFGKQLMAVSKNQIRARGQKTDKDGNLKHCYEGVNLTNAA
jgi:phage/plasmid-associated DNA primase